jgi:pimeloyl-ACP methyl ester carboxylesterase
MTPASPELPLPAGVERGEAEVDGVRFGFLHGGLGPPVVLLPGRPETSPAWLPVLEPLIGSGYRVIAPDLRGTGRSERAADGYGEEDQARDLSGLLDALGVPEPVRLVGHGIDGMVAVSFARMFPDRVARLALIDLALPEEAVEANIRAHTGYGALDAGFGQHRTLLEDAAGNRGWATGADAVLSMPVLAVGGEYPAGGRLADALRGVAPKVTGLSIGESGYFVHREQPGRLIAALTSFFAEAG